MIARPPSKIRVHMNIGTYKCSVVHSAKRKNADVTWAKVLLLLVQLPLDSGGLRVDDVPCPAAALSLPSLPIRTPPHSTDVHDCHYCHCCHCMSIDTREYGRIWDQIQRHDFPLGGLGGGGYGRKDRVHRNFSTLTGCRKRALDLMQADGCETREW